jgi:hypothetical protein
MTRKVREIEATLVVKGFVLRQTHHRYYTYTTRDGDVSDAVTHVSHGTKEIGDSLLGRMARQCLLPKKEFLRLVDCSLTREAYEALLTAGGHI